MLKRLCADNKLVFYYVNNILFFILGKYEISFIEGNLSY